MSLFQSANWKKAVKNKEIKLSPQKNKFISVNTDISFVKNCNRFIYKRLQ